MAIEVGTEAPDFELKDNHGATVKLSDFRGEKNVVLLFYPFAFTGVCTGELCALRDELRSSSTTTSSCWPSPTTPSTPCASSVSRRAWRPLLSDFWPHGNTSRAYGVFDGQGLCRARHLHHRQGGRRPLDRRQRSAGRA